MGMKENNIPVDATGQPDLSYYTEPAAYYADMINQSLRATHVRGYDAKLEFARLVHGSWGLIAKGADAIPYAVELLRSTEAQGREQGAAVLARVGKDEVVSQLLTTLASEKDRQTMDGIVIALGAIRNRKAIPALAELIENEATDGDTRWTAVESLGQIVRRRFVDRPDPIKAALDWLMKNKI